MLNLTLVQKHLSAKYTSQGVQPNTTKESIELPVKWFCTFDGYVITVVPKLPMAMYPFTISVDEHLPLNMGPEGFFPDKGQKWIFQGQWCSRWGCRGESAPQMF